MYCQQLTGPLILKFNVFYVHDTFKLVSDLFATCLPKITVSIKQRLCKILIVQSEIADLLSGILWTKL